MKRTWLVLVLTGAACDIGPSREECSALLAAVDGVKGPESTVFETAEAVRLRQELSEGAKRVEAVPVKDRQLQAAQLRYVSALRASSSKIKQQLADADVPREAVSLAEAEKEEIKQLCKGK